MRRRLDAPQLGAPEGRPRPPPQRWPHPAVSRSFSPRTCPRPALPPPWGPVSQRPRSGLAEPAEGPAGRNGPGNRRCCLTALGGLSGRGRESRDRQTCLGEHWLTAHPKTASQEPPPASTEILTAPQTARSGADLVCDSSCGFGCARCVHHIS